MTMGQAVGQRNEFKSQLHPWDIAARVIVGIGICQTFCPAKSGPTMRPADAVQQLKKK